MSIDMRQFHQTFFEESFEGLDIMENELLNLDVGAADNEVINTIFRAAHSIKGGSGTFGFTAVAEFTHILETLLDEMRDGSREVTQETVTALLESVDCVRDMLYAVKNDTNLDVQKITSVRQQLETIMNSHETTIAPDVRASAGSDSTVPGWKIHFKPHPDMLRTGNDPVRMLRALGELGELDVVLDTSDLPVFDEMSPENSYLAWRITLHGNASKKDIDEIFEWVEDECDLDIKPLSPASASTNGEAQANIVSSPVYSKPAEAAIADSQDKKAARRAGNETASIRVDINKVDEIINLVGELVITQSMLGQLGEDIEDMLAIDATRVEKMREGLAQLERNTRELQESVMRIRMLPISFVFSRMPRLVHDLSSKLNKQVELVISGEQTELDKTVMEKIGDPMVHLVRNALDHGIETPEIRRAAGKPESGTMHLNAYHQGGNIVIEISDDGAGLNRDKILKKAIERGLVTEGENITDERINDMIFHPGFSTAEQVSDVSGRGVGMDVVRKNIKALGGNVEVKSVPGSGTTFKIRLPLTLAILDGQLVKVGQETYIVPLISIIESLQVKPEQVNAVAGRAELYRLRDEYIPVIRAHRCFGIKGDTDDLAGRLMVVVEGDGQRAGIIVDDLLAQQQVVIKSLETNYRRVKGISGATILGDGTVALIADIPGLISMFRNGSPTDPTRQRDDLDTEAA